MKKSDHDKEFDQNIQFIKLELDRLLQIERAAKALFDSLYENDWFEYEVLSNKIVVTENKENGLEVMKCWKTLGAAIYGKNDPRVKELKDG